MLNFIFGSSGFAREVDWLIQEIYMATSIDYRAANFITADFDDMVGKTINEKQVLSETEFLKMYKDQPVNCFLGVGNPQLKRYIFNKISASLRKVDFPNVIHPNVLYDRRNGKVIFGKGNIICPYTVITTDVAFEDFVTVNWSCTIGHDCRIGRFASLSPAVNLSGNVVLGQCVFIGTGSRVIERKNIVSQSVIGAGATVVTDILTPGTYVGTPAKKVK